MDMDYYLTCSETQVKFPFFQRDSHSKKFFTLDMMHEYVSVSLKTMFSNGHPFGQPKSFQSFCLSIERS